MEVSFVLPDEIGMETMEFDLPSVSLRSLEEFENFGLVVRAVQAVSHAGVRNMRPTSISFPLTKNIRGLVSVPSGNEPFWANPIVMLLHHDTCFAPVCTEGVQIDSVQHMGLHRVEIETAWHTCLAVMRCIADHFERKEACNE